MATKRNSKSKAVTKVGPTGDIPDWMAPYQEEDTSKEAMLAHRVLSRVKIVQGLTKKALKDKVGGEGTVCLMPAQEVICEAEGSFLFVPVMFFPEFIAWNDRDDGSTSAIHERTYDETSPLALRCKNPDTREEEYGDGGGFKRIFCEHLNFAGFIYGDHPLQGEPIVLGFARGEHRIGSQLVSSVFMRKAPLWAQVFAVESTFREQGTNQWWGLDVTPHGFIGEDEAEFYKAQHEDLVEAFDAKRISTDYSDEDEQSTDEDDEPEI